MKNSAEDKELKTLMKNLELDSPGKGFSTKVMNQIFEIESYLEKLKSERVLGKSFWVILALFVLIGATFMITTGTYGPNGSESQISGILNRVNADGIAEGYNSVYEKFTGLPLSIAGILLASSLLVFIERFLNSKQKLKI